MDIAGVGSAVLRLERINEATSYIVLALRIMAFAIFCFHTGSFTIRRSPIAFTTISVAPVGSRLGARSKSLPSRRPVRLVSLASDLRLDRAPNRENRRGLELCGAAKQRLTKRARSRS